MPSNRPSSYQTSGLVRNRVATQARQDAALRLRQSGMSYIDIARELGFMSNGVPKAQSAAEAVRAAKKRLGGAVVVAQGDVSACPSNRTFGVEAEFFGITPAVAVQALTDAGIAVHYATYTHDTTADWKIVYDASVTGRGTGIGRGLELVSPIMQGVAGLQEVAKAVDALSRAGGKLDKSCGLHVHVGMDGLTGADMMKIIDFYAANQDNIDDIISASRHNNTYCRKFGIRNYELTQIEAFRGLTDVRAMKAAATNFTRFFVVNTSAYARHGTLEFRQHQGTLNGEKLTSWVKFILAMVETAPSLDDFAPAANFDALVDALPVDAETNGYLKRRAVHMTTNRVANRRVA